MTHLPKAPILPVMVFGANELWPPGQVLPSPGSVVVKFLPVISVKEYAAMDYNAMLALVRERMLDGMEVYTKTTPKLGVALPFHALNLFTIGLVFWLAMLQYSYLLSFVF